MGILNHPEREFFIISWTLFVTQELISGSGYYNKHRSSILSGG
jgi:hypothetical protein